MKKQSKQRRIIEAGVRTPPGFEDFTATAPEPERPVQYFSDEYLRQCRLMTADQILQFLEDFRTLHQPPASRSRLISLKVPEALLAAFKVKARLCGVPYQTQIKRLMT